MSDLPAASGATMAQAILTGSLKVSLHTADPGTTGASEVSGGSYAKQTGTFSAGALSSAVNFTGMPSGISGNLWVGVWNSAGTTFLWGAPTAAVTGPIPAGATVTISTITSSVS